MGVRAPAHTQALSRAPKMVYKQEHPRARGSVLHELASIRTLIGSTLDHRYLESVSAFDINGAARNPLCAEE